MYVFQWPASATQPLIQNLVPIFNLSTTAHPTAFHRCSSLYLDLDYDSVLNKDYLISFWV